MPSAARSSAATSLAGWFYGYRNVRGEGHVTRAIVPEEADDAVLEDLGGKLMAPERITAAVRRAAAPRPLGNRPGEAGGRATMNRRTFLSALSGSLLAAPLAAEAQEARGAPRVGVVMPSTRQEFSGAPESFIRGLRALGWVEGQTVLIEVRYADGRADRVPGLSKELASLKVNVIVTVGTTAIQAVRDATTDIPIVMAGGGDPVGTGLVTTLARPGGRITGVSLVGKEVLGKALELLKTAVPRTARVGVLMNAANPANGFLFKEMVEVGNVIGVQLHRIDVQGSADMQRADQVIE